MQTFQTTATDHPSPEPYLRLGDKEMMWSKRNNSSGHLYFYDPRRDTVKAWEFATSAAASLQDAVAAYAAPPFLRAEENVRSVQLAVGNTIYARHVSDPSQVFVLFYKSQQDNKAFFDYTTIEAAHIVPVSIAKKTPDKGSWGRIRPQSWAELNIIMPAAVEKGVGVLAGFIVETNDSKVEVYSTNWDVEGDPIGNYTQSLQAGVVTPFTQRRPIDLNPKWYWKKPGTFRVTLTVTAIIFTDEGTEFKTESNSTTFTVTAPTLRSKTSTADEVRAYNLQEEGEWHRYVNFGVRGQFTNNFPGFLMEATFRKPTNSGNGTLRSLQLVKVHREIYSDNEQPILDRNNPFRLDQNPGTGGVQYDDDVAFTGRDVEYYTSDTPGQSYLDTDNRLVWKDQYKMYFMWKDDRTPSIWVTLCRFNWEVDVEYVKTQGQWAFTRKGHTNFGLPLNRDRTLATCDELPEWQGVANVKTNPIIPYFHPKDQENNTLVAFILPRPRVRNVPVGELSRKDVEGLINRKLCLESVTVNGRNWYLTWAPLEQVKNCGYLFTEAIELPASFKTAGIDYTPNTRRGNTTPCTFSIQVAPFCFQPPEYWKQYAHARRSDVPTESEDLSMEAYVVRAWNKVMAAGGTVQQNGDAEVILSFPTMPSKDLINEIASWKQTFKIKRTDDQQRMDDPDNPRRTGTE